MIVPAMRSISLKRSTARETHMTAAERDERSAVLRPPVRRAGHSRRQAATGARSAGPGQASPQLELPQAERYRHTRPQRRGRAVARAGLERPARDGLARGVVEQA